MGWIPTVIIFVSMLALAGVARWKTNQEYVPGKPRYIPWNIVMLTAAAIAIFMLVHMFSLSGIEVGQGRGRI